MAAALRKPAMCVCKPSKGKMGYSGRQELGPNQSRSFVQISGHFS
jgi:hypothetical protein